MTQKTVKQIKQLKTTENQNRYQNCRIYEWVWIFELKTITAIVSASNVG